MSTIINGRHDRVVPLANAEFLDDRLSNSPKKWPDFVSDQQRPQAPGPLPASAVLAKVGAHSSCSLRCSKHVVAGRRSPCPPSPTRSSSSMGFG